MRVYELMRTGFLTVPPRMTVERCRDRFAVRHVGYAPVVAEGENLVGFVTCEDLYWAATLADRNGPAPCVADVMTSPAIDVPEEADVRTAAAIVSRLGLAAVPVTRDGALVGLLSCHDLCGAIARGQLRDPLDLVLGPQPGSEPVRPWRTPRSA